MSTPKKLLVTVIAVVVLVVLVLGGYVLYVVLDYSRIDDHQQLAVEQVEDSTSASLATQQLQVDEEYRALTFNIGFGAYDREFSFFLDEGVMADGTPTVGSSSRSASKEATELNTDTTLSQALSEKPDILLFQEVDVQADRSWGVDQRARILSEFSAGTWYDYATNFHSSYLFYPVTNPIGRIADSGLLTISSYEIDSAERRSLPVSDAFPTKYFDLDRCVTISRLPVTGSEGSPTNELVLINVHPSAYDEGGTIRALQMEMLRGILKDEYAAGNYVIVGGDFNHAFGGTEEMFLNGMTKPEWVQSFDDSMLPAGFNVVLPSNYSTAGTCRDSSIPYQPGVNYEVVLDGFIVSDNVQASAEIIDAGYKASDHQPVTLNFVLLG